MKDNSFGVKDNSFGVKDNSFGVKDNSFGVKDNSFGVKDNIIFTLLFFSILDASVPMRELIKMAEIMEDVLVIKSNSIIEARYIESNPIVKGRLSGALTPREMDLLTLLFTTINKDSDDIRTVRIKVSEIIRIFGLKGHSGYKHVADISQLLLARVISINDKEKHVLSQFQILSHAEYFYNEGYAEFCFHEKLKPHLLNIKQYAKYFLHNFLALNSFYSKRIYEIVMQYKNTRNSAGVWQRKIALKDLREYLGVQPKEYEKYANLKARIIKSSVAEITEKTDIKLDFEEEKLGRKVAFILFIASEKAIQTENPERPPETNVHDPSIQLLMAQGVSQKKAEELATLLDFGYIAFVVKQLEHAKSREKITNPAGWLIKILLEKGFEADYQADQSKEHHRQDAKRREARKKEISDIIDRVKTKYREYFKNAINTALSFYDEAQLERKKEEFIAFLVAQKMPDFAIRAAQRDAWFSMLVFQQTLDFFEQVEGVSILSNEKFAQKIGVENYLSLKQELENFG